jgi:ABC-type multidrug transport system ATPase subunit
LLFSAIDLGLWFLILFLVEWWKRIQCRRRTATVKGAAEDQDVIAERERVEQGGGGGDRDQLVVKGLTKKFGSQKAVAGLSFGIPRGQCFGLLGVNGAGKTTTFRMLTGEISMSSGAIELDGFDVASSLKQVRQRVGYCPQYDGLIHTMTGTEMLWMYARLRGIAEDAISRVVAESVAHFDLANHCERLCGTYSGGNKRKLATAIALMGSPPVIFLDEPTTGMDPAARRGLWDSLAAVTRAGKSIVLTTHSMEECEALCHRLAIMKQGTFRCIGTPQHLKSRFGAGYTLVCKLPGGEPAAVAFTAALTDAFPGSAIKERFGGELTFAVPGDFVLSSMFEFMEQTKRAALGGGAGVAISDYSISQTSLEQIFVSFAQDKEQRRRSVAGADADADATAIEMGE